MRVPITGRRIYGECIICGKKTKAHPNAKYGGCMRIYCSRCDLDYYIYYHTYDGLVADGIECEELLVYDAREEYQKSAHEKLPNQNENTPD